MRTIIIICAFIYIIVTGPHSEYKVKILPALLMTGLIIAVFGDLNDLFKNKKP